MGEFKNGLIVAQIFEQFKSVLLAAAKILFNPP